MQASAGRQNIKDLTPGALRQWLARQGQPRYRAVQIEQWLYRHLATDFAAMKTLPAKLRAELAAGFLATSLESHDIQTAGDGTIKWLFGLPDGEAIETVLLVAPRRTTACISTQVGCPVRCVFCASGRWGWTRDLSAGEIIDQVLATCRQLGKRVDNVVVMGIGEPLLNLDHLLPALDALCDPARLGLGARHITISTSGIVPGIYRLAEEKRPWNLALSLHAADDAARAQLIPPRHRYPLSEILEACRAYREATGRMITLEYALIAGRNDSPEDLRGLARIAREMRAKVNVIPCNPVSNRHTAPPEAAVGRFLEGLLGHGVQATVRRRRGEEIQAACGQLRNRNAAHGLHDG